MYKAYMYTFLYIDLVFSFLSVLLSTYAISRIKLILSVLHIEKDKTGVSFRLGEDSRGKIEGGDNKELLIYPGKDN